MSLSTVADLRKVTRAKVGDYFEVAGHFTPGDGGAVRYRVVSTPTYPSFTAVPGSHAIGDFVVKGAPEEFGKFSPQVWQKTNRVTSEFVFNEREWDYIGPYRRSNSLAWITLANGLVAMIDPVDAVYRPAMFGLTSWEQDAYDPLRDMSAHLTAIRGNFTISLPSHGMYIRQTQTRHPSGTIGVGYGTQMNPFYIEDCENVVIEGNNCLIEQVKGYTTRYKSGLANQTDPEAFRYPYQNLVIQTCKNVEVGNLRIDGSSRSITRGLDTFYDPPVPHVELPADGILIRGGINVWLHDIYVRNALNDGYLIDKSSGFSRRFYNPVEDEPDGFIYIQNSKNIIMERCHAHECERQGMSITGGRDGVTRDCVFSNTGRSPYGGHSPGAGLDVEADRYPGDSGNGTTLPFGPRQKTGNWLFENCTFKNNNRTVVCYYERHENVTFKNCKMIGLAGAGAGVYDIQIGSPNTVIDGCELVTYRNIEISGTIANPSSSETITVKNSTIDMYDYGNDSINDTLLTGFNLRLDNNTFTSHCRGRVLYVACFSSIIENCDFIKTVDAYRANAGFQAHSQMSPSNPELNKIRNCRFLSTDPDHTYVVTADAGYEARNYENITKGSNVTWFETIPTDPQRQVTLHGRLNEVYTGKLVFNRDIVFQMASAVPTRGYFAKGSRVFDTEGVVDYWRATIDGWACNTAWASGAFRVLGDYIHFSNRVYQVIDPGGNLGVSGPVHVSGDAVNGDTVLRYMGPLQVFTAVPIPA